MTRSGDRARSTRGWKLSGRVSLTEAKAKLSECVRAAEGGESVVITRHGKPVVVLVQADEIERLEQLRAAGPEGGLAGLAGGWEGSANLVRALKVRRRNRRALRPGRR